MKKNVVLSFALLAMINSNHVLGRPVTLQTADGGSGDSSFSFDDASNPTTAISTLNNKTYTTYEVTIFFNASLPLNAATDSILVGQGNRTIQRINTNGGKDNIGYLADTHKY